VGEPNYYPLAHGMTDILASSLVIPAQAAIHSDWRCVHSTRSDPLDYVSHAIFSENSIKRRIHEGKELGSHSTLHGR
jgi:hypothetical protein